MRSSRSAVQTGRLSFQPSSTSRPVAIDGEVDRNVPDAAVTRWRSIAPAGPPEKCNDCAIWRTRGRFSGVIETERQHRQPLRRVCLRIGGEQRQLIAAGHAPGGPEGEDHDTSAQVRSVAIGRHRASTRAAGGAASPRCRSIAGAQRMPVLPRRWRRMRASGGAAQPRVRRVITGSSPASGRRTSNGTVTASSRRRSAASSTRDHPAAAIASGARA